VCSVKVDSGSGRPVCASTAAVDTLRSEEAGVTRCTHLHVCGPCSRQPPERKGRHLGAARMKRSRGTRVWEGTYPSTISIALAGMVRKNVAAVGGAMAGLVEEEMTTSPLTACLSETSFAGWRALSRGPHSLRSPAIPWTRKETHGVVFPLADTGCKIRQCSGAHLHSHQLCVAVQGGVLPRARSSQHTMNGAAGSTQLRCQQRPSLTVSHAGGVKALG
jgi:hypothetical protein